MWRWIGLLAIICTLSYGYGVYSVINATFPLSQLRALKKAVNGEDAGFLNPAAAEAATIYRVFHRDADIAMVGDSITAAGPWAEIFPEYNIVNRGVGGDTTLGVLNRVDDIIQPYLVAGRHARLHDARKSLN